MPYYYKINYNQSSEDLLSPNIKYSSIAILYSLIASSWSSKDIKRVLRISKAYVACLSVCEYD
jgi:hypothetical protein